MRAFLARIPLVLLVSLLASGSISPPPPASAQELSSTEVTPFVTERGDWRVYGLSPDGTMVVAAEPGAPELCTVAVPSGEELACADLEAAEIRLNPADITWAPDSSGVLFAENVLVYLTDGDLWFLDAHSGDLTNLTDDDYTGPFALFDPERYDEPVYGDVSPAWSPDGSTIAFSRTTLGETDETPTALWTLDVETGEASKLADFDPTFPGALYWGMAWAPDGETIYATAGFVGYRTEDNGVWAFDAETGDAEHLAGPSAAYGGQFPSVLAVSPAGDTMVISYPVFLMQGLTPEHSGYALLDLASGDVTPIEPSDDMAGELAVTVGPTYAPDGRTLIFGVRRPMETEGLIVARDLASGDDTVLVTLPDGEMPTIVDPTIPLLISDTGVVYIQTAIESGVLLQLPEELVTPAAATPDDDVETSASPAATDAGAAVIVIGDRAAVLRSAPDSDAQILMVLQPGTELEPFGEPIDADGRTWLPVREPESGLLGYVRADFLAEAGD